MKRERKYQNKSSSSDFVNGVYPISDIITPMAGTVLEALIYENINYKITTWKDFLCKVCEIGYCMDYNLFEKIVYENQIHKATSKNNFPLKDPIITKMENLLIEAKPIGNTGYFSEGNISSNRARFHAKELMEKFKVADEIQISVSKR